MPVVNVTEVSEGGGPEVSSTNTRASGSTRGATGPASGSVVGAWRLPHAPITAAKIGSLFAARKALPDIAATAALNKERGEK